VNISRRGVFLGGLTTIGCGVLSRTGGTAGGAEAMDQKDTEAFLKLYPVGRVDTKGKPVKLLIHEKYRDALKGLDGFSHAIVFYWFDRNDTPEKRNILQVHPRGNKKNPLTGVFACRAPVRPNLIALSVCKILAVSEQEVSIDKIDALDGSPILDIKPYIPSIDCRAEGVRVPDWLRG
jgi:tRNA-Thr(GGU) m(6)t(6)A37 methyltransferase TsaA